MNILKLQNQKFHRISQDLNTQGITTDDIDKICHEFIIKNGAYPTCLGFNNYPKTICTSVNEVLCHGIPDQRPLENGDYLNLDISLYLNGVHGDTSIMIQIGEKVHPEIQKLIKTTQQALYESIKICQPGHGIGHLLHLPPVIYHCKKTQMESPYVMEEGMVFTIEPIFTMQFQDCFIWEDQFTVVSPFNPSAQWEHTVLVTDSGYEVLTQRT
ncbi:methionyl aminopeptidase, putative [Ichthyophthirius multifiliis]|uniref:Methionyl aminopeptidase, putative n=1 Tax=Ichthyophthirius multifiliis TaxID=5932 RepID=G0R2M4_ICHMU|nr:methionyl aminopeptidase, putative [Ichthyophthirius multifiliis]EGR28288.1 methionyl aminopeptidase, putative [Ichthyophthirius multifiliis]|eukprot:XP_004027633.1 methionyl aminopeptidase, putative [Ichthyophthirius multifiliis]